MAEAAAMALTSRAFLLILLLAGSCPSVAQTAGSTRLVDIGGGRKMYLECRGAGSPTVVLISGVFDYIERYYNPKRRHSTIRYLSPVEFGDQMRLA
jgi:hypothetical protein